MENTHIYSVIDPQGNACNSSAPYCGYSYKTLQDMASNGYTLQIDGKEAKFPTRAKLEQAQADAAKKK